MANRYYIRRGTKLGDILPEGDIRMRRLLDSLKRKAARALFLVGLALWSVATGAVHAQEGQLLPRAPFETPWRSMFTTARVDSIAQWFDFTEDQVDVLRALHSEHQATFRQWCDEHEAVEDEFDRRLDESPARSPESLAIQFEREEVLGEIADEQQVVDDRFFESIRLVLSEDQLARWPGFLRWFNRQRWLSTREVYLEEPIDLLALLEELVLEAEADRNTLVPAELEENYAIQMDAALRARADYEIEAARHWLEKRKDRFVVSNGKVSFDAFDPNRRATLRDRKKDRNLHERIRDVNRQFSLAIQATLESGLSEQWSMLYQASTTPREARPVMQRWIKFPDLVEERLSDLSESQKIEIDVLIMQQRLRGDALHRRVLSTQATYADANYDVEALPEREALREEYRDAVDDMANRYEEFLSGLLALLSTEQQGALSRAIE